MGSYSMKLNEVSSCISGSDRIKVWQRYLQSLGLLSSVTGNTDDPTKAATEAYGRKIYKSGNDVFVMSFDRPDHQYYEEDSSADLTTEIEGPLGKIAYGTAY